MEEKKEPKYYRKAELPHLRTTVYFMDLSQLKGIPHLGSAYTTIMDIDEMKIMRVAVFIENIEKTVKKINHMPTIAHELSHVKDILLEHISGQAHEEKEHMAYITSYLFETLLN